MAHQARTRADLAAWGTGAVSPEEFESLDKKGFQSINGDDGGTWAPVSQIQIGGAGFWVSGAFNSTGGAQFSGSGIVEVDVDAEFNNPVTFNDDIEILNDSQIGTTSSDVLTVFSTSTFRREVLFNEDVTIGSTASDDLVVASNVEFQSPVLFTDDVVFGNGGDSCTFNCDVFFTDGTVLDGDVSISAASDWTFGGDVFFNNDVVLGNNASDTITLAGTPTLAAAMAFSGVGRIPFRTGTGTNGNQTFFSTDDANVIRVPTQSASHAYTISDTGAVDGDWFLFFGLNIGENLDIDAPGGSGEDQILGSTGLQWKIMVRVGGTWRCVAGDST